MPTNRSMRFSQWHQLSIPCTVADYMGHTHTHTHTGFPGGSKVKNLLANAGGAGDTGSIHEQGKFPEGGNSKPLQYSCLKNIPRTEEPIRLHSTELQSLRCDWAHSAYQHIHMNTYLTDLKINIISLKISYNTVKIKYVSTSYYYF